MPLKSKIAKHKDAEQRRRAYFRLFSLLVRAGYNQVFSYNQSYLSLFTDYINTISIHRR
jgi:hypothetical protein